MRAFAKRAAALALLAWSAPAAAQGARNYDVEPSATPAIVTAAQECRAAMTAQRVDEPRLAAAGWVRAMAGQPSSEQRLHELRREQVIIWLPQAESSCIVMARVRDAAQYDEVIAALTGVYGRPAQQRPNGGALWLEESGAGVQADKSGSRERLGIRLFMLPPSQ